VLEALAEDLDDAYEAFVRLYADAVYGAALRLTGSRTDADDVAQETFVRAYRALGRYDAARIRSLQARAWLLTITTNLCRNRARTMGRRAEATGVAVPEVPDPSPGPEPTAESVDEAACLASLLRALPERHRVPVVLRHVVGLSYAEIATVLECPEGTAKAHVGRGLERLRDLAAASPAAIDAPDALDAGGAHRARRGTAARMHRHRRRSHGSLSGGSRTPSALEET
jgi:RNA polymerase sigma-70 factor (ECF subfamily)